MLEIEQNIKSHFLNPASSHKLMLILISIFSGVTESNPASRHIAALILRNSIKQNYAHMIDTAFDLELVEVEFACFVMVCQEVRDQSVLSKKLWVELNLLVS